MTSPSAPWMTDKNLAEARRLWDRGISASFIAFLIGSGVTKSAIVGYAHRQGWPARPSPIIRNGGAKATTPAARVPDKPHHRPKAPAPKPVRAPRPPALMSSPKTVLPKPVAPPVALPAPSFRTCQWPTTDGRPWRFCEAATDGGPWCPEHNAICRPGRARIVDDAA